MPLNRAALVAEQSQFYRNNYRRLLLIAFIFLIIAYGMLAIVIFQHVTRPIPQYFVTTIDGRLIEIKPIPK